jgi:CO/xanthine dehydrogenase Mo-binding subunit
MIYALTIRSPISRGILKEIKSPELPGSYHLITAKHITGENQLTVFPVPVLAEKNLFYSGQPVAIIAGPEEQELEELSARIEVVTEEEKPVFLEDGYSQDDVLVERNIVYGEPIEAEEENGKYVSGTYYTGMQEHWYPEPHGAVAVPSFLQQANTEKAKKSNSPKAAGSKKATEAFTIYTATQWPFHVKSSVAQVLGWDSVKVSISPTLMTLHLDGKLWYPSLVACHAALASWVSKCPVKLMLTKEEDFLYSPKRNRTEIKIHSALGEKGDILSSAIHVKLDLGAAGVFEDEIMDQTCLGALGAYKHKAFKVSGAGIRTNLPPQGPLAGFGLSQGFFAIERQISRIADSLGQDPAEWRKKNFLEKNQNLANGIVLKDSAPLKGLIDAVARAGDYYRKWEAYELLRNRRKGEKRLYNREALRGIGISTAFQGSGFLYNYNCGNTYSSVELTLEKDGFLEIRTSLVSSEVNHPNIWQNLAHEILGVDPSMVRITCNTDEASDSGPGTLSRNMGLLTSLVERCCSAIKKQRFRDPLPITVKRSIRPDKISGWDPERITDSYTFSYPGWGAAVVEIEIDPVSLEPGVRGIWLVVDGGKILNESKARHALKIGIIHALGWTCWEQVSYEEGKIPLEQYLGYNIPAPEEIPPIRVDFYKNDSVNPKGIGDLPFCCVPAAYVQAVSQAMDHHFERIPLNAREMWNAWELKKAETQQ